VNCYVEEVYTASRFFLYDKVELRREVIEAVEEVLCVSFVLTVYYVKFVHVSKLSQKLIFNKRL
jgi:hypothetical protein